MSRMSENMGAPTFRNPKGLHGLYRDNFFFYISSWHRAYLIKHKDNFNFYPYFTEVVLADCIYVANLCTSPDGVRIRVKIIVRNKR
jgi:hypothetical protein